MFYSTRYVNGMECHRPSGWRHWGGLTCGNLPKDDKVDGIFGQLGGTYNYYNSSQVIKLPLSVAVIVVIVCIAVAPTRSCITC
jgi:hypothetical protein